MKKWLKYGLIGSVFGSIMGFMSVFGSKDWIVLPVATILGGIVGVKIWWIMWHVFKKHKTSKH